MCLFFFHMFTLAVLMVLSILKLFSTDVAGILAHNINYHSDVHQLRSFFDGALVTGFSTALLGVSGFESSANFVEEQAPGVFPKTLRNMWIAVSFINVMFSILIICLLPLSETADHLGDALAFLAYEVQGPMMRTWLSFDAFFVCAASVLTSYVGVCGLVRRMAGDKCFPSIFLLLLPKTRAPAVVIMSFCVFCAGLTIKLQGKVEALSAVYSLAFLLVMSFFAISVLVLKIKRPYLPREIKAPVWTIILAFLLVFTGFSSQLFAHTSDRGDESVVVFLRFTFAFMAVVTFSLNRTGMFRFLCKLLQLDAVREALERTSFGSLATDVNHWATKQLKTSLQDSAVIYFSKDDSISRLNKALLYIFGNEDCNHVRIIHCYNEENGVEEKIEKYFGYIARCEGNFCI